MGFTVWDTLDHTPPRGGSHHSVGKQKQVQSRLLEDVLRQMIWRASTSCLQSSYFKDGDLPDDPASYVFAQLHVLGVSLTTQIFPLQLTDPTTLHLKLSQVQGIGSTLYGCSRLIVNVQYNDLWVTGQVAALLDLVKQL